MRVLNGEIQYRGVTRNKLKSGNLFKHQRMFVVSKTTSNITRHLKSGAAPLYHSLMTSTDTYIYIHVQTRSIIEV